MKWIALGTAIGWTGIVWLAYRLADARTGPLCHFDANYCDAKLLAARDAVLTGGLTVALAATALSAVLVVLRNERLNRPGQAPASTIQAAKPKRLR